MQLPAGPSKIRKYRKWGKIGGRTALPGKDPEPKQERKFLKGRNNKTPNI